MNVESKTWNTVGTGLKIHAFNNGTALCRSNYKNATPDGNLDYCEATDRARSWGLSLCTACVVKFNAAIERLENSLRPSTGEGDHLPPAEDTNAPAPAATRAHHYNSSGGQLFIAGRGWVNHCKVCQAPEGTGDHFHNPATPQRTTNEEDSLPIDNGPLTERQTAIIGHVRAGLRYRKVAEKLGISEVLVRQEVVTINRKLRATTLQQAIGIYATAQAYLGVAVLLDSTSRAHPEQDGTAEDHVNHILMMLANEYRSRAARLLPQ